MIGAPSMHDIIHARARLGQRAGAQAIARFLGCSIEGVQRILGPRDEPEVEGQRSKAEMERALCNAWNRGDTIETIQDQLGLSLDQVKYMRRRLGLAPRAVRDGAAA